MADPITIGAVTQWLLRILSYHSFRSVGLAVVATTLIRRRF